MPKKPSILIVDDLPEIHSMLISLMGSSGYECAGASSGEEALLLYKQSRFDVVLNDYTMTPMDGLTLTEELRKIDSSVVSVLFSGFLDKNLERKALAAGCSGVIEKPFNVDHLLKTIEQANAKGGDIKTPYASSRNSHLPTLEKYLQQQRQFYTGFVIDSFDGDKTAAAKVLGLPLSEIE